MFLKPNSFFTLSTIIIIPFKLVRSRSLILNDDFDQSAPSACQAIIPEDSGYEYNEQFNAFYKINNQRDT